MKQRIVPFVDHEIGYRLLQKLIELFRADQIELPAVVTTAENGEMWWPRVGDLCENANIPLLIYKEPFKETLLLGKIDWYLLLSWKHIIPAELITHPDKGVINLHYSLLPDYRGVYPVNWAIIDGREKTGITYHLVNEKIDGGEIIIQVEAPILLSDTARSLQTRLDNVAYDHFDALFTRLLSFKNDNKVACSCNTLKKSHGYYSRQEFNKRCEIDLDRDYLGMDLFNLFRGLTFFSNSNNAYFIDKKTGRKIYISIELREE